MNELEEIRQRLQELGHMFQSIEKKFDNDILHLKLGQAETTGELRWVARLLVGVCLTIIATALTIIARGG